MTATTSDSYRRILGVGTPMVLSSAAVMAAQLGVTALIGAMGPSALYVRSVYMPVSYLFIAVTTGLAVTLQVVVARSTGRGERATAPGHLLHVACIGVVLHLLLGVVLVALGGPLADAVHIPSGERGAFLRFLAAMVVGTLFGLLGELGSATLRGLGRTTVAAGVTAVTLVVHLGLIVLGVLTHQGLWIVPVAAGSAGVLEIALVLMLLARREGLRRPRGRLTPDRGTLSLVGTIGVPVSASYLVLFLVSLLLLRIVSVGGPDVVAGFNLGYTLQSALIVPAVAFGSAVALLMNQRLGAAEPTAARALFHKGLRVTLVAYAVPTGVLLAAPDALAAALSTEPQVREALAEFLTVAGPAFGCTGVALMVLTVLEQTGRGPLAVMLNVFYFAVVVALGLYVVDGPGDVPRLYWVMCAAAAVALAVVVPLGLRTAARLRPPPAATPGVPRPRRGVRP
ncbi:MATE family efflux transporter [Streptomyces parvus]|uniref:MATE family efflux transporter n=1 Tax=Streptomyces parvus TaxID=66428 RepID=UPI00342E98ED